MAVSIGQSALATRTVLVVEDDALMRDLLCRALRQAGFVPVPAGSAAEALKVFAKSDPDGVLLDLNLGVGPTGADLAVRLRRANPSLPVVFLTHFADPRAMAPMASFGDSPYLLKSRINDFDYVVATLDQALRGRGSLVANSASTPSGTEPLTSAQLAVLRMVAKGMSNAQIADARQTTVRAVEQLISKAFHRAGYADQRSQQHRVVLAQKIVTPGLAPDTH